MIDDKTRILIGMINSPRVTDIRVRGALIKKLATSVSGIEAPLDTQIDAFVSENNWRALDGIVEAIQDTRDEIERERNEIEQERKHREWEQIRSGEHEAELAKIQKTELLDVATNRILDQIAFDFPKHWSGKIILVCAGFCLVLMGVDVSLLSWQTSSLLKVKAEAEQSSREAKAIVSQATIDARAAQLAVRDQVSNTAGLRDRAIAQAVAETKSQLVTQGLEKLNTKEITSAVVAGTRADAQQRLAGMDNQLQTVRGQATALSKQVGSLDTEYAKVSDLRTQVDKLEADSDLLKRTLDGQKQSLQNAATVQIIWSALRLGNWIMVAAAFLSVAALLTSIFTAVKTRRIATH